MSLVAACVWSASGLALAAHAAVPPGTQAISRGGFGDHHNGYAWSMAWFKGRLYVGTARTAVREHATMAYYFPGAGHYLQQPAPDIRCPPTTTRRTCARRSGATTRWGRWTRVYRSPRVANPRAPRTGDRPRHRLPRHGRPQGARPARGPLRRRPERRGVRTRAAKAPSAADPAHDRRGPLPRVRGGPGVIRAAGGRPAAGRVPGDRGARRRALRDGSAGLTGDGVVMRVRDPRPVARASSRSAPRTSPSSSCSRSTGRLYAGTGDPGRATASGGWAAAAPGLERPSSPGARAAGATITSVVSMEAYRGSALRRRQRLGYRPPPGVGAHPHRTRRPLGARGRRRPERPRRNPRWRPPAGCPTGSATSSICTSGACRPTAARSCSGRTTGAGGCGTSPT